MDTTTQVRVTSEAMDNACVAMEAFASEWAEEDVDYFDHLDNILAQLGIKILMVTK